MMPTFGPGSRACSAFGILPSGRPVRFRGGGGRSVRPASPDLPASPECRPAPRDRAGSGTGSSPDPLRRPTAGSPGSGPRSWMSRPVANRPALRREPIRQGRELGRFPAWTGAKRAGSRGVNSSKASKIDTPPAGRNRLFLHAGHGVSESPELQHLTWGGFRAMLSPSGGGEVPRPQSNTGKERQNGHKT